MPCFYEIITGTTYNSNTDLYNCFSGVKISTLIEGSDFNLYIFIPRIFIESYKLTMILVKN